MTTRKRPKYPFLYWFLAILLLSFSYDQEANPYILHLDSIEVKKDASARFAFELDDGENLAVRTKVTGKRDLEDVSIEIYDMTGREPKLAKTISRSVERFQARNKGNYILRIATDKRNATIDLKLESQYDRAPAYGSTTTVLNAPQVYINEGELVNETFGNDRINKNVKIRGNVMKLFLDGLLAGDVISISCNDKSSGLIKTVLSQTAEAQWLSGPVQYSIEEDGNYTVEFFVEQNDKVKSGINLFKSENFYFTGLEVNLRRPPKPQSDEGRPESFARMDTEEEEEEEFVDWGEILQDMQSSSAEERERAMQEMRKSQQNANSAMMEVFGMMNRKKQFFEPEVEDRKINMSLDPQQNIIGEQCDCKELDVYDTEQNLWFFWLGSDAHADSLIRQIEMENGSLASSFERSFKRLFRRDSSNLTNVRAMRNILRREFPDPQFYEPEGFFREIVEFTIVDEQNKEAFLEGLEYRPYYNFLGTARRAEDIEILPIPDTDIWICTRNKNQFIPVSVSIHYYTLNAGIYYQ